MNMRLVTLAVLAGSTMLLAAIHAFAQQDDIELPEIGPKITEFVSEQPLVVAEDDTELQKVLKQKHNAALAEVQIRYSEYRAGAITDSGIIFDACLRLLDAELDLVESADEKSEVLKRFIDLAMEFEGLVRSRVEYGGDSRANLESLRYERLKLKAALLRL